MLHPEARRGRGATANAPSKRFDDPAREIDADWLDVRTSVDDEVPPLRTSVAIETPRTIISRNTSPDVPFDRSLNAYRGCEHGCIYCFARPTHAYLGLSPGLDFESKLTAKPTAPVLLRAELSRRGYVPDVLAMGRTPTRTSRSRRSIASPAPASRCCATSATPCRSPPSRIASSPISISYSHLRPMA